jgi:prepilin peptidase CpaA
MPNWLNGASLAAALAVVVSVRGPAGFSALGGGIVVCGFAPAGLFFLTRGEAIGGGDVKALMTLGAWLGPSLGLECQLVSLIALTMMALVRAARRGRAGSLLMSSLRLIRRPSNIAFPAPAQERSYVRFGPYLAFGTCLCCANEYLESHYAALRWLLA